MPRIDDYNQARDLARKQLLQGNPELVARFSGATINGGKESGVILSFPFLNRRTAVAWGDFRMSFEETDEEVPIRNSSASSLSTGLFQRNGFRVDGISAFRARQGT
jgi:hypothetical protein